MVPSPTLFVVGSVVAAASAGSAVPLLTQMYRENYPDKTRGTLFSRTVIVRILSAVAVSEIAGRVLTYDLALFRALLLSFSGASLFAAFCLYRCPTLPLKPDSSPRWFNGARCIVDDSLFRNTLIAWMLMGFGNLMMNPLRVEYLADPKYGLSLTVSQIAFLNSVLPNLIRVVLTPFWGRLFDKADFFVVRMVLNLGYLSAILSFFTSTSNAGLVVGALIFGAANAGGEIAWSLWVTKLAPPGKTADYMAVHIFLTGLRGVAAPFAAFYAVTVWPLHTLAVGAALLIFAATLMILAEWAKGSRLVAPQERVVTSL
jgi:MFS family permease